MTHPRTVIRRTVVVRLREYATAAGNNVFDSRSKSLFDRHLPALLVYARDERVVDGRYDGDGSMALKRELELCVEAVDKGSDDVEERLDDIALEIEAALDGFTLPERRADVFRLKSTETDVAVDGSKTYGAIRLTFSVTYHTNVKEILP